MGIDRAFSDNAPLDPSLETPSIEAALWPNRRFLLRARKTFHDEAGAEFRRKRSRNCTSCIDEALPEILSQRRRQFGYCPRSELRDRVPAARLRRSDRRPRAEIRSLDRELRRPRGPSRNRLPVVYQSGEVPTMAKLATIPLRPLDDFETKGLAAQVRPGRTDALAAAEKATDLPNAGADPGSETSAPTCHGWRTAPARYGSVLLHACGQAARDPPSP